MATTMAARGNEGRGFAIAAMAHVVIIGLLSVQWTAGERRFDNPPMEVDLIAETAVQSTARVISETPPAARLGEEDNVDIAAPEPMPAPPLPEPVVRPTPAPTPKQVAQPKAPPKQTPPAVAKAPPKAAPKAPPAADRPARPTGRLDGIAEGLSKSQPKAPASKGAPAAATAAEVRLVKRLAIALLVVSLLIPAIHALRLSSDSACADEAVVALAKKAGIAATDATAAEAEIDRRLALAGGGPLAFSVPASALYGAMRDAPGVALRTLSHRTDGTLTTTLAAPRVEDINAVLLALQARGYRVSAQPMAGSDGQQMANITIRAVP